MFVKKLVDDLNKDNETLVDSSEDLKHAFVFLVGEHKKLQFELEKAQRNSALVESYREQFIVLKDERDEAYRVTQNLREKCEILHEVMKVAANE